MERLSEELIKVDRSLRRRPQADPEPIGRRIGRWQGRYSAASKQIEARLVYDDQSRACALRLSCPLREQGHPLLAKGAYLLRTNCTETDPAKLWRWYIQLTQAEAAFRSAKSDIGLRPIYHQKTDRVEAHLLICFLSLALWRSLESWMSAKGLGSRGTECELAAAGFQSTTAQITPKNLKVKSPSHHRATPLPRATFTCDGGAIPGILTRPTREEDQQRQARGPR